MKILLTILAILIGTSAWSQSLDSLMVEAARNNAGLQAAYKDVQIAITQASGSKSLADPRLSFGYFVSPIETRVGPQNARIGLSQMFPWFGTLKAREQSRTLIAEARYQEFLHKKNKLFYEVAAEYYPILALQNMIELEEDFEDELKSYKNLTTNHFSGGHGSMVNVLRVDLMLKDSENELTRLYAELPRRAARLNGLLNRSPESGFAPDDSLNLTLESLPILDSGAHPAFEAMDLQIRAAQAAEQQAKKEGSPQIGIGLDYFFVGEREGIDIADNGKNAFLPSVSVTLPIFRKKYKAREEVARQTQEKYALLKGQRYIDAEIEMTIASESLGEGLERIELIENQIRTTEQAIRLLFTHYSESGEDFEEVLRMQKALLELRKSRILAVQEYLVQQERIKYITGSRTRSVN